MTAVYVAAFVVGGIAVLSALLLTDIGHGAMPLSEIERLSIIGGAGDTQDAVRGLLGVSPMAVAKIIEALKSSGIDLPAMLNRTRTDGPPPIQQAEPNSHPVAPPTS